jgi:hypothetical protein
MRNMAQLYKQLIGFEHRASFRNIGSSFEIW